MEEHVVQWMEKEYEEYFWKDVQKDVEDVIARYKPPVWKQFIGERVRNRVMTEAFASGMDEGWLAFVRGAVNCTDWEEVADELLRRRA